MKKTEILRSGYVILKDKRLIIEVFSGLLTLENYKSHRLTQSLDVDFNANFNLFVDIRSVTVTAPINDVKAYVDYVIKVGNRIGDRKTAVLVETPNQRIYATELKQLKGLLHDLHVYAHIEPAVKWVTDELTIDNVEEIIQDIRNNPPFIFYSESGY